MKIQTAVQLVSSRPASTLLAAGIFAVVATLASGCSPVAFSTPATLSSLGGPNDEIVDSTSALSLRDAYAHTQLNTPVVLTIEIDRDDGSPNKKLLISKTGGSRIDTAFGSMELVDASALKVRYTPGFNYRGEDSTRVFMRDGKGRLVEGKVKVQVDNPLATLRPGLAVRATGCIMCHANVNANVITDFGFGGDGRGADYFFGRATTGVQPRSGAIYGDHAGNWQTVNLTGNVIVPKAPLMGDLGNLGALTLGSYLRNTLGTSPNASTRASAVTEQDKVYIGAPSVERLRQAAGLAVGGSTWKFYPESRAGAPLSGLVLGMNGRFVTNDSMNPLVCSGDLAIDSVVYLKNLKVKTEKGCRLYVTKSVFIEGPIEYVGGSPDANLQIVSARSISMGLGQNTCGAEYNMNSGHSLQNRMKEVWTIPGYQTRETGSSPQKKAEDIFNDSLEIGNLVDAACLPAGRDVTFERLILNAPHVNSRYKGNFRGVIIAEIALMSLGSFKYEFDPIFAKVPVLPLLKAEDYLVVQ